MKVRRLTLEPMCREKARREFQNEKKKLTKPISDSLGSNLLSCDNFYRRLASLVISVMNPEANEVKKVSLLTKL